jgi:hypothetical protein
MEYKKKILIPYEQYERWKKIIDQHFAKQNTSPEESDQLYAKEDTSQEWGNNSEIYEDIILSCFPKSLQSTVKAIISHFKINKEKISWNTQGELILNKEKISQSHMVDLIKVLMKNYKTENNIIGLKRFLSALADINFPLSLISNIETRQKVSNLKLEDPHKTLQGHFPNEEIPSEESITQLKHEPDTPAQKESQEKILSSVDTIKQNKIKLPEINPKKKKKRKKVFISKIHTQKRKKWMRIK